jgi:hypothetical protein
VISTVHTLVQSIESGSLFLSVGNPGVNITSLEACGDLKCQHVYLDTDKSDNNDGMTRQSIWAIIFFIPYNLNVYLFVYLYILHMIFVSTELGLPHQNR